MKRLLTSAIVGASILGATLSAFAGEGEGIVESVDPATNTVILEDGSTWTAAEGVDVSELAAGDNIKVMYDDGTTILTSIEKM